MRRRSAEARSPVAPRSRKAAEAASDPSREDQEEARESITSNVDFGRLPSLVGFQVRRAYGRLFQTLTVALREIQLAPGQYSVLLLIGRNAGLNQMTLAEAAGIERSTIVPITKRFARLGWIRRVRRRDDQRVYSLRLTALGRRVLARADELIEKHEESYAGALSSEERRTLIALLSKVGGNHAE